MITSYWILKEFRKKLVNKPDLGFWLGWFTLGLILPRKFAIGTKNEHNEV
jgi:hypothetical protein